MRNAPENGTVPSMLRLTLVAFVVDQVNVAEDPKMTLVGETVKLAVGNVEGGGVVVALTLADCTELLPAASYADTV